MNLDKLIIPVGSVGCGGVVYTLVYRSQPLSNVNFVIGQNMTSVGLWLEPGSGLGGVHAYASPSLGFGAWVSSSLLSVA